MKTVSATFEQTKRVSAILFNQNILSVKKQQFKVSQQKKQ